ncbi:hypothetical protein MNBD_GAMMA01-68 [hydrothermal vent metagenome]|uniref:Uncharacterized protein n=1 Tax=hydrothermal vent metagenome TaxID=652676 RepID=A0A3B0VXZ9_9ZZZZ
MNFYNIKTMIVSVMVLGMLSNYARAMPEPENNMTGTNKVT